MSDANSTTRKHPAFMLVGSLLLLVLVVGTAYVVQIDTAPAGGSACSEPVRPFSASGMTEVFQLTPGSTGSICVSYGFRGEGFYIFSVGFGTWFNQSAASSTYYACGPGFNIEAVNSRCSGVTVTPSTPRIISIFGLNITVAYTVKSDRNASGLYWLFIANCEPTDLVFGPLPTSAPVPIFTRCMGSSYAPSFVEVTGVSNVNVIAVPTG